MQTVQAIFLFFSVKCKAHKYLLVHMSKLKVFEKKKKGQL